MARPDRMSMLAAAGGVAAAVAAAVGIGVLTGGSGGTATTGSSGPASGSATTAAPTLSPSPTFSSPSQAPTTTAPSSTPTPSPTSLNGATPAPTWLGTRLLPTTSGGFGIAERTPPELVNRRIITVDVLPPPPGGTFRSSIGAVPASVAARSSWEAGCPVRLTDLRYVTVSFRGFDGLAHTGELLLNRSAAAGAVRAFRQLFGIGYPIEQMTITTRAERDAPPTGDGNNTSAFVCRAVRGQTSWSEHAYGRAIDVNPFINPYVKGDLVLPELAVAYTDRSRRAPGMIVAGGPVVKAFRAAGFSWGGSFRSLKDYQHFSTTGR